MNLFHLEDHTPSDDDRTFYVCRRGHKWKEIKAPNRDVAVALFMEEIFFFLDALDDDEWFFVRLQGSHIVQKVRAYPVIATRSHDMWTEEKWNAKYAEKYGEVPK